MLTVGAERSTSRSLRAMSYSAAGGARDDSRRAGHRLHREVLPGARRHSRGRAGRAATVPRRDHSGDLRQRPTRAPHHRFDGPQECQELPDRDAVAGGSRGAGVSTQCSGLFIGAVPRPGGDHLRLCGQNGADGRGSVQGRARQGHGERADRPAHGCAVQGSVGRRHDGARHLAGAGDPR